MSQKDNEFQSKSKKFGGSSGGGEGSSGKGFSKRFERDSGKAPTRVSRDEGHSEAPSRSFSDKPRYEKRDSRGGDGERSFKKPGFKKDFKPRDRDDRGGSRSFGDKKPRSFGDKPRFEKRDGERPARSFGDKPTRAFGDKPRFEKRDGERPARSFGDKPRFEKRDGERPARSFGDKPRFEKRDGERSFGKKPFGDKKFGDKPRFEKRDGERPARSFGDKPRFEKRDGERPARSFGDKPRFEKRDGERSFGKKPFGDKKFGERKFGDKKFGDKKPFQKKARDFDTNMESFEENIFEPREATAETRGKLKSDRPSFGSPSPQYLFGVHASVAAIGNPKRTIKRILVTEGGFNAIRESYEAAAANGIARPEPVFVEKGDIDRLLHRDAVHQDILLDCAPEEEVFLADIIINAGDDAVVVVLDQVTDPHNVGAILRSASAFGAIAVVAQKLHAPEITGTLAKTASGAVEYVPIVREVNLSRALEQLKEAGFTCLGLDERGKRTIVETKATGKIAIVLGAEGDGLRRLVAENCDELVKLPTQGPIASLNVSNAAAIALYELVRSKA